MITRVRLRNWKSHLDSEFRFSQGVNALMGIMGSGKSSVMQAISFALFGTFPSHQSKKVSLDDLVMTKPQRQRKAEVELDFSLGEDQYSIKRVVESGKGTTHAEIRKNGQLVDVNPAGVTREIERVLQIDYDLFSKAVYSEQDGIDYFLRLPKGQRMVQIDRMVKLDRFESVRERVVALKNRIIERRKEKMRFVLEMGTEDIGGKMKSAEDEIADMVKQKEHLAAVLGEALHEREMLERGIMGFEDMASELNELKMSMNSVAAGMKEVDGRMKEISAMVGGRSPESIRTGLERVDKEISGLRETTEAQEKSERSLIEKVSEGNAEIMLLSKDIAEREEKMARRERDWERFNALAKRFGSDPDKEYKEKLAELESSRKHLYGLECKRMDLLNALGQLTSSDGKCPVCDSVIDDSAKDRLVSEKVKNKEETEKAIARSRENVKDLELTVSEAESASKEIAILKERLKDYGSEKEELEQAKRRTEQLRKAVNHAVTLLKKLRYEKEKNKVTLKEKEAEGHALAGVKEDLEVYVQLEKRFKEYTARRALLEKDAAAIEAELGKVDIKALRLQLQKTAAVESGARATLKSVDEKLQARKDALADLDARKATMEKYQREVLRDELTATQLETFTKVLKVTQEQLREEFLKSVNAIMNRVWEDLYPYSDFPEIRLMIEEGDYVLKMRGSDGWITSEGVASGGERSMAVLALRIGFSLAFIPNLRWLILDEPTHNLDMNAIQQLSEVLREKMDRFAEQVFLITHEDGMAGGITGQLYRLERDKASDGATRVKTED